MALVSLQDLTIAFGGRPLLDRATLHIERGERIGLVGRNGEGKSTLLRIVADLQAPDDGSVILESGTRVSLLDQQVPMELRGPVRDVVRTGLRSHAGRSGAEHEIERVASLVELDPDVPFESLSGGQKRRALLARAIVSEPEVLLLDEPTNHLDMDGIDWLESFLLRRPGSLFFVTHDRLFLQRLATRIVELDRGRLTSWNCDYPTYLIRKEALLAAEERQWANFDDTLAKEEAWIRQGIKARRTRNEGRVRALEAMRRERAARRERVGTTRLTVQEGHRTGRSVVSVEHMAFSYADQPVVRDLSVEIMRGDRVGIVGPNGAGKTTLLRLLLGQLAPASGSVKHGTSLEIAYFDQHRETLDENASVADNVAGGNDWIELNGQRRHVLAYLQDFLFSAERAKQPVRSLSGGERNRLLLARLFTRPANVLVLDEPTNDLDAETLELLESALVAFDGTVLVVSHDRAFLDNLCTSCLVFEDDGEVREYVGGYSDWKRASARKERAGTNPGAAPAAGRPAPGRAKVGQAERGERGERPRKLSFAERREYDALPDRIETMEAELASIHERLADPDLYKGSPDFVRETRERAATVEADLNGALERWAELAERAD